MGSQGRGIHWGEVEVPPTCVPQNHCHEVLIVLRWGGGVAWGGIALQFFFRFWVLLGGWRMLFWGRRSVPCSAHAVHQLGLFGSQTRGSQTAPPLRAPSRPSYSRRACWDPELKSPRGVLRVRPTGGGWVGYEANTKFVYLEWASHFWPSVQNFIPPPRPPLLQNAVSTSGQPKTRRPSDAGEVPWRRVLKERSRFSNHPLIDTQWEPSPDHHWVVCSSQLFMYELMRIRTSHHGSEYR